MLVDLIGKRIRLVHTNDPYTRLKTGDEGTITDVSRLPECVGSNYQLWVQWDSGSRLALLMGIDKYEILSSDNENDDSSSSSSSSEDELSKYC